MARPALPFSILTTWSCGASGLSPPSSFSNLQEINSFFEKFAREILYTKLHAAAPIPRPNVEPKNNNK